VPVELRNGARGGVSATEQTCATDVRACRRWTIRANHCGDITILDHRQPRRTACACDGKRLKEEFHRSGGLQLLLLRYTQALITQMAQTAVCNRHHSVDQQLCRWLLLSLDRVASNELVMTQELIANMLGVRREGVTEAAGKLQKLGAIRYSRGQIKVVDRPMLEQLCCECYSVVKLESDRIEDLAATREA
jgi:hypothetical protein